MSVARASCRKDASCQKRRDHECGILAFAGANLLVWWSRGQNALKSPGMRSKPSSYGIAHRRRPLRDTKRAEDPPSSPKSLREQKSYRGFWAGDNDEGTKPSGLREVANEAFARVKVDQLLKYAG